MSECDNSIKQQIDDICEQFLLNWSPIKRPEFSSFLRLIDDAHRQRLMDALLNADMEIRLSCTPWHKNDADHALDLLDAVPEQFRRRQWHYWQSQIFGSELTLCGHSNPVNFAAFCPDGVTIISTSGGWGDTDNPPIAKHWDLSSAEEIVSYEGSHRIAVNLDHTQVASADEKCIQSWNLKTGEEFKLSTGHKDGVRCVAVNPDGLRVVTGGYDGTLRLWQMQTGEELKTLVAHNNGIQSVAFSPDGKMIVSTSFDEYEKPGTIKIWNAYNGEQIMTFEGHEGIVFGVVFSPNRRQFASTSHDKMVKLWDIADPAAQKTLGGHVADVNCVAFSPDGKRIVSASLGTLHDPGTLKIWESESGEQLKKLEGHQGSIFSAKFSPDSSTIATSGDDHTIRLWHANNGDQLRILKGHTSYVNCVGFSPDGQRVVSAGSDKSIKLWNASPNRDQQ